MFALISIYLGSQSLVTGLGRHMPAAEVNQAAIEGEGEGEGGRGGAGGEGDGGGEEWRIRKVKYMALSI